jgi:K+-sensing histidine kinase KdpD
MNVSLIALLPLAAVFSLLASAMAFLIAYNEYSKHFQDSRQALRSALGTGLVTLAFFLALSLIAGFVLDKMLSARF